MIYLLLNYLSEHPAIPLCPILIKVAIFMQIEFYTVNEFLKSYAISRTEFYRQVNKGKIRLTKLGTASRIARVDAEAWADSLPTYAGPLDHEVAA